MSGQTKQTKDRRHGREISDSGSTRAQSKQSCDTAAVVSLPSRTISRCILCIQVDAAAIGSRTYGARLRCRIDAISAILTTPQWSTHLDLIISVRFGSSTESRISSKSATAPGGGGERDPDRCNRTQTPRLGKRGDGGGTLHTQGESRQGKFGPAGSLRALTGHSLSTYPCSAKKLSCNTGSTAEMPADAWLSARHAYVRCLRNAGGGSSVWEETRADRTLSTCP